MARISPDFCAKLTELLKKIIFADEFVVKHRQSEKNFVRNRKLPFSYLILFMLNILRSSIQNELDNFFKIITSSDVPVHFITKGAFSKARKKLKYQAFVELNNRMVDYFYSQCELKTWKEYYVKAVDGSKLILPYNGATRKFFGTHVNTNGENHVVANILQIFDCLNGITTSALIAPESIGERELLATQIDILSNKDLLLLDRGYPAFWMFALFAAKNIDFCARIDCSQWKKIKNFVGSNEQDKIIEITPTASMERLCEINNVPKKVLNLRLVKIELASGQTEILITSLTDRRKYKNVIFKELYHLRWPVEEDYKIIKHKLETENFSGKSVESVFQDFHAKIFTKNLTAILKFGTQSRVDAKCAKKKLKYSYVVNTTNALSKMKGTIVLLFTRQRPNKLINQLLDLFECATEALRPNRKQVRIKRKFHKRFFMQYKPIS